MKKFYKRRVTLLKRFNKITLIGCMIIGLGVVVWSATSALAASPLIKASYGGSTYPGHVPIMVAIENGAFKEAGFDVTFNMMTSYERMAAFSAGRLQFAGTGASSVIGSMAQNIQTFYSAGACERQFGGYEGLVARAEFPTVESLRGKRIGVQPNSSSELTAGQIFKSYGMRYGKDMEIIHVNAPDQLSAIARGSIDAAVTWEPFFSRLKAQPGMKALADERSTDLYKKTGYQISLNLIVLQKDFVDQNPANARKLLQAYFKTANWVMANPAEALNISIKGGYLKESLDILLPGLKNLEFVTDPNWMVSEKLFEALEAQIAFYHELGKIRTTFDPRPWFRKDLLQ